MPIDSDRFNEALKKAAAEDGVDYDPTTARRVNADEANKLNDAVIRLEETQRELERSRVVYENCIRNYLVARVQLETENAKSYLDASMKTVVQDISCSTANTGLYTPPLEGFMDQASVDNTISNSIDAMKK